jgi:predicted transport protein
MLRARRDVSKVKMSAEARLLFEKLQARVTAIDTDILELAESNSVSYHGPEFFLEILPRRYKLTLLLALDFNEVDDPSGFAHDATQWKFFVYAKHEGGVHLSVDNERAIEASIPFIRKAYEASCK